MKIATNIETTEWNRIIKGLIADGWILTHKYDAFDAGIDFDFLILSKNGEKIIFGWDNWVEGEIKCSEKLINELSSRFGIIFMFGEPMNLKQSVINLTKAQIKLQKIIK